MVDIIYLHAVSRVHLECESRAANRTLEFSNSFPTELKDRGTASSSIRAEETADPNELDAIEATDCPNATLTEPLVDYSDPQPPPVPMPKCYTRSNS